METAASITEAKKIIEKEMPLFTCSDLDLPDGHALEFCDWEALTPLKESAERAENMTVSMKDGLLRMSVFVRYFDERY